MSHPIQSLRRLILSKTLTLLQHLQIQHQSQKPISYFPQFLSSHSPIKPQIRNFYGAVTEIRKSPVDKILLRLLRKEIQYELDHFPLQPPAAAFNGFKVDERPGEQWISLEKTFGKSEEIKVEVTTFDGSAPLTEEGSIPGLPGEEIQLHITMIVNIFKRESNQVLELICSAWPDSLEIQRFFVHEQPKLPINKPYTGPKFEELDSHLRNALFGYLEERGIDDYLCILLHKYINCKDKAEYIRWMQSVESVVERMSKQ